MPSVPGQRVDWFTPEFRRQWVESMSNTLYQTSPLVDILNEVSIAAATPYSPKEKNRDKKGRCVCPYCGSTRSKDNTPKDSVSIKCIECGSSFTIFE